ncbi:MAG: ATP-dependent acyl-CoA ligase [Caldimonas sp.]
MKIHAMRDRVIGQLVAEKARLNGDRTFVRFEDRSYSYRDLDVLSNRIANGLAGLGVGKGTHVAFMLDNKPEIILVYFALAKLGAVAAPLNTAAKGELLAYYLTQSDSELVIADAALVGRIAAVTDRAPKLRYIIALHEEQGERVDIGDPGLPHSEFAALLAASDAAPAAEVRFCDLHTLIYTSGTTGPSKGNMSTHAHALSCGFELAQTYGYQPDDVLYVCLPMFHGNAWLCSVLPAFVADASIAVSRRFSASTFWDEIRRYGATQFNSLGAMTNFIWSRPPGPADRDHKVRQVMVVPTPQHFYHAFEERFGIRFTSVYALTDCGMVTARGPNDPPEKWASGGKACEHVEIRIADDDDFEVPCGQTGEILVRTTMPWLHAQGYYNMPEATARTVRNLWFHTGDRGYLDADGYVYFVDRKKDAIRRRGENISSFEVEQIILKHPAVLDVAAFPVASEHSEDEVMVSVVLREGAKATEAELTEHCRENMAYFMVPRFIEFVAELPKTMTEKVEKYKLRADAEKRLAALWDREKSGIVVKR